MGEGGAAPIACFSPTVLTAGWLVRNSGNLVPTVLEAGRLITAPGVRRVPSCGLQSSRCALTWWRGEGALWGAFHKSTNPMHEGSTLMA